MELSAEAIWLAMAAVDMRTGVDGLSLHVQQALGRAPGGGTAYVFANRRRARLHRHIRPQYACRPCQTVTAAAIRPADIDSGLAAVGLRCGFRPANTSTICRCTASNRSPPARA